MHDNKLLLQIATNNIYQNQPLFNTHMLQCYLFSRFLLVFSFFLKGSYTQFSVLFYFYNYCFTLPLQLSSAAHLSVFNSSSPFINLIYLLQMRPYFTLSYAHLPFNFHSSHSQLSHAYLIITHASLLTITHHVFVAVVCS